MIFPKLWFLWLFFYGNNHFENRWCWISPLSTRKRLENLLKSKTYDWNYLHFIFHSLRVFLISDILVTYDLLWVVWVQVHIFQILAWAWYLICIWTTSPLKVVCESTGRVHQHTLSARCIRQIIIKGGMVRIVLVGIQL